MKVIKCAHVHVHVLNASVVSVEYQCKKNKWEKKEIGKSWKGEENKK